MKRSNVLLLCILILGAFLRFYQIDKIPPGLYVDEASIGYNAYTILHTGRDEFGVKLPLFFESFGDYKPPVYIYMTSGSMWFLGKDEFAIRVPSAFLGTLTLLIFYIFSKKLIATVKEKKQLHQGFPLMGTLLLAISPWHIHFSRGGFEVNVALFFYLLGCLLALIFWQTKKIRYLIVAIVAFITALYTYHTYRVIVPITLLFLLSVFFKQYKNLRRHIVIGALLCIVLSIPVLQFSFTANGNARFASTSAFTEYPVVTIQEKLITYPMVFVKNYFAFFSSNFLFSNGDGNGRHQIPGWGVLFKWELPFLLFGIFLMLRQKYSPFKFVAFGLLLLAPIAPAVARPSPHTLRALLLVIPLTMFIAYGFISLYFMFKNRRRLFLSIITFFVCLEFLLYLHGYYAHYPQVNALDWGAGYKDMTLKAQNYKRNYGHIVVDNKLNFAPIYFKFYAPSVSPEYVEQTWKKPQVWKGKVLYIRPNYGPLKEPKIIDQVYLPGPNKDIYSQFWKL